MANDLNVGAPIKSEAPIQLIGPTRINGDIPPSLARRMLIALLALNAGKRVGRDQIEAELWHEGNVPTKATVHTHILHARRSIPFQIKTIGSGYALLVDPNDVDILRFVKKVEQAVAYYTAKCFDEAFNTIEEALFLIQGSFFEDIRRGPRLEWWFQKAEDYRKTALYYRFEISLCRGHHETILNELLSVWRADYSQESTTKQLMLALYRSMRRIDAIKAYRTTTKALREEHGLDPSPQLRELHQKILNGEVDLLSHDWTIDRLTFGNFR